MSRVIRTEVRYDNDMDVAKIWGWAACAERTVQGKDSELVLTVKMKITHLVDGPFGSEFLAICNHCRVMTA